MLVGLTIFQNVTGCFVRNREERVDGRVVEGRGCRGMDAAWQGKQKRRLHQRRLFLLQASRSLSLRKGHDFFAKGVGTAAQGSGQFSLFVDQKLGEVPAHFVVS